MYMLAAMWFVPIVPRTTLPQDCWHVFPRRRLSKDNTYCFKVQGESNPSGQDSRLERQGRHETLTPLGGTYGEVGCMMKDMLIGVCVLLCFINSRVRKIRNDAFSCPVILSRTRCLTVRASWFHSSSAGCSCVAISASGVILRNRKIHRQLGSASQSSMQRGEVGIWTAFSYFPRSAAATRPQNHNLLKHAQAHGTPTHAAAQSARPQPEERTQTIATVVPSEIQSLKVNVDLYQGFGSVWHFCDILWHFCETLWYFKITMSHFWILWQF